LEKDIIRKLGLCHFTTHENAESILEGQEILSNNKVIYFFVNKNVMYEILKHNMQMLKKILKTKTLYLTKLSIKNLTEQQIDLLRVRPSDNAIVYKNSSFALFKNKVTAEKVQLCIFLKAYKM